MMHRSTPLNAIVVIVLLFFFFVVLLLFTPGVSTTGRNCSFPVEWRGRYYQTGLKEVVVRENAMTTKGVCVEQNNKDYFLFYNRESQCYHCLLIMRQHRNIIQYKESYCTKVANMSVVCHQIRVEATLYTMVKEPVVSGVKCPFQHAFNFTYSDAGSEFCAQMESYAKPCVSQTRYQLTFRHCTGYAEYHDKEFHLECLATWKDGSEMYLYGRLSGSGLTSKDERYRCFKYHHHGNEMSVSMSADTSCRGLRSATDGPLLMKFSRDSLGSLSSSSCRFPDWLGGVTWRSLDGRHQYTLDSDAVTLSESLRSSLGGHVQRINEYRCNQQVVDLRHGDDDDVTMISYTSHKCSSRHQCLRLKRLADRVIRIFQGPWVEDPLTFELCRTHLYSDGQLLFPDDLITSPCPRPGYYVAATSDVCPKRLEVGCHNDTRIGGHDRCQGDTLVLDFDCLLSWSEESKAIVITRVKDTDRITCFSFSQDSSNVEWLTMNFSCDRNQTHDVNSPTTKYLRLQNQDNCQTLGRSTGHSVHLATHSPPHGDQNLFSLDDDDVQPRRRSKPMSVFDDEDDDDDDDDDDDAIFSGDDHPNRKSGQHPVTWRRSSSHPVSTPGLPVFQISSSSRRTNSVKLGAKGQSNRGDHEGRPDHGREEMVEGVNDRNGCGRPTIRSAVVLCTVFASLVRFF